MPKKKYFTIIFLAEYGCNHYLSIHVPILTRVLEESSYPFLIQNLHNYFTFLFVYFFLIRNYNSVQDQLVKINWTSYLQP